MSGTLKNVVRAVATTGAKCNKATQYREFSTTIRGYLDLHRAELARRAECQAIPPPKPNSRQNIVDVSAQKLEIMDPTIRNYTPAQGGWVTTNPICLSQGFLWTPQY